MADKAEDEKESKKYARRPIPLHALEEALKVAAAIQDKNAGKPWKPIFVADALGIKPTSSNFRDITSSAYKYGLIDGTWNAEYLSLSPLGKSITKPGGPQQELRDKQKAVLNVEVFKNVYDHYRDAKFPSADSYFKNMLETEFGVPRELIDECVKLLLENGRYSDIIRDVQGAPYVVFAEIPPESKGQQSQEKPTEGGKTPAEVMVKLEEAPKPTTSAVNQIFVIHGKDTAPVEQLKKLLSEFKIPFKVAIDEPHVGRPISQKVSDLMKTCTSAIVVFTSDEEYVDPKGNKLFRPSDNAVYELGAASVLYGDKIVILKEEDVTLPSDFSDLGHITFKKDEIDAKSMQLIKELIGFGLLKFTTA